MTRLLCVANWSEGRNADTLAAIREPLRVGGATVHFDAADPDHNRTVTAFSGSAETVVETLYRVADAAFTRIDMRAHQGVHPRIGALDVCPFIILSNSISLSAANALVAGIAKQLSETYRLPIFLYESSETGKHAADLPDLRKGQFEGLFNREIAADYGPPQANRKLGATVMGVRNWLTAANANLETNDLTIAKQIAKQIRQQRDAGTPGFAGIRALGLPLESRGITQVSMNFTMPDQTPLDNVFDFIRTAAGKLHSTELIGVIRPQDLHTSTCLQVAPQQVVEP